MPPPGRVVQAFAQLDVPQIRLAKFGGEDKVRIKLDERLRHRSSPLLLNAFGVSNEDGTDTQGCAATRRPWAVEYNRFAVKERKDACVARQPFIRRKALHPTAQVSRALRATLGHGQQHAPYAEGVTPHSPGSSWCFGAPPWATDEHTQPYAEGVTPRSPGSRCASRCDPGSQTTTLIVRRRRYTPQPRVDALRGAPWVTDNNTHSYAEGVPPHNPGSTRFAAHPGSRTTTRSRTPKALHPTAQGRRCALCGTLGHRRQHASVRRRRSTPQPRVDRASRRHPGSRTTTRSRTPQALHPTAQGRRAARRTLGHRRQHARIPRRGFTKGRNHDGLGLPVL